VAEKMDPLYLQVYYCEGGNLYSGWHHWDSPSFCRHCTYHCDTTYFSHGIKV